ncbi:hypothetical protein K435DRAFT_747217 [Dendrothele bispora CBS 962.96]|uniref:Protein-S-isoprenylcysteine O-methyltransferase n=1 Tax=Dendrothele bispora (strain CBS 962.96) TaxID=1314807 RepID=A0A4V4HHU7_DENBC|nr:hypothetical protein K435DRAFT_747217 [Dendrothele bispora CBS 962.96]
MAAFLPVVCLILAVPCVYICFVPPFVASKNEVVIKEFGFTRISYYVGLPNVAFQGSIYLLKAAIILLFQLQTSFRQSTDNFRFQQYASQLCLGHDPRPVLKASRIFYFGFACMMVATILRYETYRVMGRQFTFDVTIRGKDHKLITTGPYHYVRHPGYTGFFLVVVAGLIMLYGEGSWLRECGFMEMRIGQVVVALFMAWWTNVVVRLWGRMSQEDELLKEKFGEEWVKWREEVRYKLIPGLY